MASVSVFDTTRFTALAAGDVIPAVDVSNTSQNAHGSLLSITVTNFFAAIPVPIYASSATALVGIRNTSALAPLHVGNGTVNKSSDSQILLSRAVDNGTAGAGHGFSDSSPITRTGTIAYNSYDAFPTFGPVVADYDHFAAFQARVTYNFTGTITHDYGFYGQPIITAGTVTNRYAFYAAEPSGAGTLTNNYGLYVEALTKGGTLNYAIYTNAGLVSLGGALTVRSGGVAVTGNSTIAGTLTSLTGITSSGTAALGTVTATGSIKSSSATGAIGYATGAGGTVTQGAGSGKATGVTLNTVCGRITMDGAALAGGATVSFTWTNSAIAGTDLVFTEYDSGTIGAYKINIRCGGGQAVVDVTNTTAGSLSEALAFAFFVLKAVTS